jgi:mycobactin peptide synthetase MbtE
MFEAVHVQFENIAGAYPGHVAVKEESKEITYQQLDRRANVLANVLISLGAAADKVAGVLLLPGIDLAASMLAIMKSGAIYLPLSEAAHGKKLPSVLQFTEAAFIIINTSQQERLLELMKGLETKLHVIMVDEDALPEVFEYAGGKLTAVQLTNTGDDRPGLATDPEQSSYIFFTSGSTSTAKAIVGSSKGLAHFIQWEIKEFGIQPGHRVSQLSTITFDASLRDFFVPFCSGGTVCIPSADTKSNIPKLMEWISSSGIETIHCVPSIFRLFLKELELSAAGAQHFKGVKQILMAGEPLYSKEITAWRDKAGMDTELVNLYGTTETTMAKSFHRIKEVPANPAQALHVGKPIDNAFIAILNNQQLCKIGEIGEVYILTRFMTKGYLKNEELNKKLFVPNPLAEGKAELMHKTGDIGRYLPDRSVEILGRTDDQAKVNGIRIDLSDIREAVLKYSPVAECEIIAQKTEQAQTDLVCYITGKDVDVEKLRTHLKHELADYAIPAYFILLKEFPLTINGKIDKRALPAPEKSILDNELVEEPKTETERKVAAYWKLVLGMERISRKAPFFKTGGNSLKAIQLISRIYKDMNVLIKINELFKYNTIEQIADFIDKAKKEQYKAITPMPAQDYYDLSPAQKRLWISTEADREKAAYNVPDAYSLEGPLDTKAFAKALATIVERHEILRTTFLLVEGQPKQKVHPVATFRFKLEEIDIRKEQHMAASILYERSIRPFELSKGPLFRAALLHVGPERYIFSLVVHHIISDAWSMDVLNYEILSLYNAYAGGKPSPLKPLKIQYRDYAAWANERKESAGLNDDREFWIKQFSGEVPILYLPVDFPRGVRSYRSATIGFMLDKKMVASMQQLAENVDCSFFMLFLAFLQVTLYEFTGQEDFVLGSPVASRDHPDLEDQIGFYINTLPLRCRFSADDTFTGLLRKVKKTTLEAFEHQAYTFDQLVDELNLHAEKTRNLLFDFGYTYINLNALPAMKKQQTLEGISIEKIKDGYDLVKTDMWFKVIELNNEFSVEVSYNKDLFRETTAQRFMNELKYTATAALEDPSLTLHNLVDIVRRHRKESSRKKQDQLKSRNLEMLKGSLGH